MKQKYCSTAEEYYRLVFDNENEIMGMMEVSEGMVCISYKKTEGFEEVAVNTNPVLAALTTSQARLKLYQCLELLQERILYFDTDSVIYLSRKGDTVELPLGDHLGQLTDEVEGKTIVEFAAGQLSIPP